MHACVCHLTTQVVLPTAVVDAGVQGAAAGTSFQFERLGFFVVDPDTTSGKMVFNRTLGLREGTGKPAAAAEPGAQPAGQNRR